MRSGAPLTLAALALALVASAAASSVPRHVDPLTVGEHPPNPLEVARLYWSIASRLAELDMGSAMVNVSAVKALYVPERLRAAVRRLNELLEGYVLRLNDTKALADLVAELVGRGDYNSSLPRIPQAYSSLAEAMVVYDSLSAALRDLTALGVPGGEVERIARSMGVPLELLRGILDELRREVHEALGRVVETRLSIWVSRGRVRYGEPVEVFGALATASGEPLEGRSVDVHFGPRMVRATTGPGGLFRAEFVADLYVRGVTVYAEFVPETRDLAYSRSNEVVVTIDFLTPTLRLALANDTVLPGRSTYLTITTGADLEVVVSMPFANAARLRVPGEAVLELRVPEWAREGTYEVVAESVPRGYLGPARANATLRVVRLDPGVQVDAPGFALAGLPVVVRVTSSVDFLLEARSVPPLGVEVEVAGSEVRVGLPLSYLEPRLSLVVSVVPLDPAYRVVEVKLTVPVYNPVSVVAPAAGIGVALAAVAPRLRRGRPAGAAGGPRGAAGTGTERATEGPARRLFSELLGLLRALTGVAFEAHQTFREYLDAIRGRVSEAIRGVLARYFSMLEGLLYGPPPAAGSREGLVADLLRDLVGWLRERLLGR